MTEYSATSRFSHLAGAYAKYRFRDYPSKVCDTIFARLGDPRKLVVADIGAGTGIASSLIASRGARVIAVDPDPIMRENAAPNPLVEWRDGTAEATGLGGASVDIVATFQAFHWFEPQTALAEFRRIARHRIVSVQYEHEESDRASAEFEALLRAFSIDDSEALRRHALETFAVHAGSRMRTSIMNVDWSVDREGLFGYLDSISFVPHEGEAAADLRAQAEALYERFERRGALNLPLRLFVLALDI